MSPRTPRIFLVNVIRFLNAMRTQSQQRLKASSVSIQSSKRSLQKTSMSSCSTYVALNDARRNWMPSHKKWSSRWMKALIIMGISYNRQEKFLKMKLSLLNSTLAKVTLRPTNTEVVPSPVVEDPKAPSTMMLLT